MSDGHAGNQGHFVASAPVLSQKLSLPLLGAMVIGTVPLALWLFQGPLGLKGSAVGEALRWAALLLIPAAGIFATKHTKRGRRNVSIWRTIDGLAIEKGGEVSRFPVTDAKLGGWYRWFSSTPGTALHLHNGRHGFVLGGVDHHVVDQAWLQQSPVLTVDAWMSAPDFEALLITVWR